MRIDKYLLLDGSVDVGKGILAGDGVARSLLGAVAGKGLCQLGEGDGSSGGGGRSGLRDEECDDNCEKSCQGGKRDASEHGEFGNLFNEGEKAG